MFGEKLREKQRYIDDLIKEYSNFNDTKANILFEAMKYSLEAGGKRIRPVMLLETFSMLDGKNRELAEVFATATEMIHTFSLIHDDLPAMDDDDYRRGKLTNHKVYGEAVAILAGDSLLNDAYGTIVKKMMELQSKEEALRALDILMNSIGPYGIMGGQTVDVISEKQDTVDLETIRYIHEYKTTIFIQACLKIGAILAGATEEQVDIVNKYGYNIGLAFQIQDDILDVIGTSEELGKPVGSDEKNDKATYVKLIGLEESKEEVERLTEEAVRLVTEEFGKDKASFLIEFAEYLKNRRK